MIVECLYLDEYQLGLGCEEREKSYLFLPIKTSLAQAREGMDTCYSSKLRIWIRCLFVSC